MCLGACAAGAQGVAEEAPAGARAGPAGQAERAHAAGPPDGFPSGEGGVAGAERGGRGAPPSREGQARGRHRGGRREQRARGEGGLGHGGRGGSPDLPYFPIFPNQTNQPSWTDTPECPIVPGQEVFPTEERPHLFHLGSSLRSLGEHLGMCFVSQAEKKMEAVEAQLREYHAKATALQVRLHLCHVAP
eukprot:1183236-Prorocentrum_minimum.AAC.1